MKISESAVALQGERTYSKYQETQVESVTMRGSTWNQLQKTRENQPAELTISEKSQSLLEQLKEQKKAEQSQREKNSVQQFVEEQKNAQEVSSTLPEFQAEEDQMLQVLRRILEILKQMRSGKPIRSFSAQMSAQQVLESDTHFSASVQRSGNTFRLSQQIGVRDYRSASVSFGVGNAGGSHNTTAWVRHTEKSGFMMEQENTTFSATGIAKTADGREITFGVDLEMSRGFAGSFFESSTENVVLTDPLVINLSSGSASVSDQKFFFDLDADGNTEEISSLGEGSGFLAYDKNGDGVINDGSELFGTKSGDGFADLEKYDEDGNGWIDENDEIFRKLKVWTKNAAGEDELIDLKTADVGAIYLDSVSTQFHLKDAANRTDAVVQKTGVFLRESGSAGTIQHVDLAV